jgi:hypothetical protein
MIRIESNYDKETDNVNLKYKCDKTCTIEHLYIITTCIEKILENDDTMTLDEIRTIVTNCVVDRKKEGKKNDKRNSKSKTKV